jgi:hypothetical protein
MRCSSLVDWPAYARFEGALCGLLGNSKVGGALTEEMFLDRHLQPNSEDRFAPHIDADLAPSL